MAREVGQGADGRPVSENNYTPPRASTPKPKPSYGSSSGGRGGSVSGYGGSQLDNARIIISVGRSMGMSDRDIQIGLMTAMQESGLRTGSSVYKKDHDSIGLFQQRPYAPGRNWGWGTEAELNDPATATRKFFSALKKVSNRNSLSMTEAAATVQRPRADLRGEYAKHAAKAATFMQQLGGMSKAEANKYIAQAGSSSSGGGGGGGSTTVNGRGLGVAPEDNWDREDFEAALAAAGFGSFLINSNKELKDLFADAIQGEYTPERFKGEIRSTKWYRDRSDSQREYDTKRKNDPGTWARELENRRQEITTIANQLGITLSKARLEKIATSAYRNGITDDELTRTVAAEFTFDPKKAYKGMSGQTISRVRELAASYGIQPSRKTLGDTVEQVLMGSQSIEGLQSAYREQAKRNYSHFAKEFDAGLTLDQIADPYREAAARTLELNPEDLRVTDKTIQMGLARKDAKTGTVGAVPLWQYEESLRKDDRWLHTNNARESMLGVGRSLLTQMGLVV